jgi:uncharacterized protein with HEPN domain
MKPDAHSDWALLSHMRDCLATIEECLQEHPQPFTSPVYAAAILHNLQLIAQSSMRLSSALLARHPEGKWPELRNLRNVIVHDYFGLRTTEVEEAMAVNLPILRSIVLEELATFPPEGPPF